METTYFGLLPTYLLLISFKITTFLLLLSSNTGKVAELWTLLYDLPGQKFLGSSVDDIQRVALPVTSQYLFGTV